MLYKLPDIRKINVANKTVLLRADLDVPVAEVRSERFRPEDDQPLAEEAINYKVVDEMRLVAGLPTIEYLLGKGAKVIVCGHLGRPPRIQNSEFRIQNYQREFSMEPVAFWLCQKYQISHSITSGQANIKYQISKKIINGFSGWEITPKLFLLENLRFYEGEEENDLGFAKKLASLADIYVNDAFAAYRKHASIAGVPRFLPHFAGFHFQKEIEQLSKVLNNPLRPLVVVIGGLKIDSKLPIVSKMLQIADYVLVGGKIAQEIKISHQKLIKAEANQDKTDITQKSVEEFLKIISLGKMIVWNGPMGKIGSKEEGNSSLLVSELPANSYAVAGGSNIHSTRKSKLPSSLSLVVEDTEKGTRMIAKGIIKAKAYKIVGGGDTVEFLQKYKLMDKFDFVSTGGGAMLSFLSGEELPAIKALIK